MTVEAPVLRPRQRHLAGCCPPVAEPDLTAAESGRLATAAKALADPTRVRIVDAVRAAAPEAVCQCELLPLFDLSQPGLAKHLRVLLAAGVLGSRRRGAWTYYFLMPNALEELRIWLS